MLNKCARHLCNTMLRSVVTTGLSNRERLLQAALVSIRQRGYARTTARDIASAAGVSLGAIGYHYGSTEALLLSALQEGFAEWTAHVGQQVMTDAEASAGKRAEHAIGLMLETLEEHRNLAVAFVEALAAAMHSEMLQKQLATMLQQTRDGYVASLFAVLGEDFSSEHAEVLASMLIAVLDGLMIQSLLDPAPTPTGAQIAAVLTGLRPILGGAFRDR